MIASTIAAMRGNGITLYINNGVLRYKALKGALTPSGLEFLKTHRVEIINHLMGVNNAYPLSPADFGKAVRQIPPEGKTIALSAHNARIYGRDTLRLFNTGRSHLETSRKEIL